MHHGTTPAGIVRRRAALSIAAALGFTVACESSAPRQVAGGEPSRGRQLIRDYTCHGCHIIPGVRGANGLVGPPLISWAGRAYIAGQLPNTPDNLIRWIRNPQEFEERTAMPNMGVTEQDARHIAAYLFSLR